jgi:hypothetical protein
MGRKFKIEHTKGQFAKGHRVPKKLREQNRQQMKDLWNRPGFREKQSTLKKERWENDKYRKNLFNKGRKKCSRCGIIKNLLEFPKDSKTLDGYNYQCKNCRSKWKKQHKEYYHLYYEKTKHLASKVKRQCYLRLKYNLSVEEYNRMLEAQNGVCAICGKNETRICKGSKCNLSVDHNHETGKIRALLCSNCNVMLAKCEENLEWLDKIKNYIIKHN